MSDQPAMRTKLCACGCGIRVEDGFHVEFYYDEAGYCRECGKAMVDSRLRSKDGKPCYLCWLAVLSAQLNRHAEELAQAREAA